MKSFDQTLTLERHGDVMVGDESFINGEKLLENISQFKVSNRTTGPMVYVMVKVFPQMILVCSSSCLI